MACLEDGHCTAPATCQNYVCVEPCMPEGCETDTSPGGSECDDAEIVGRRESRSLPHAGIVETRAILTNQHGEEAYETTTTTLVLKRPQAGQEKTG